MAVCLVREREMSVCLSGEREREASVWWQIKWSKYMFFSIFVDDIRSDFFLLMCSIAEKALDQLKMSLSRVKSGKTLKHFDFDGFRPFPGSYKENSTC